MINEILAIVCILVFMYFWGLMGYKGFLKWKKRTIRRYGPILGKDAWDSEDENFKYIETLLGPIGYLVNSCMITDLKASDDAAIERFKDLKKIYKELG